MVKKGFELDLGVAQHIRVGRAPGLVLAQELGKHAVFVVRCKVHVLDLDAQHIGHAGCIQKILAAGAKLRVVIVFPVFHEDADDLMALLLEHMGGHGGIHAAGQTDDYALLFHGAGLSVFTSNLLPKSEERWYSARPNCGSMPIRWSTT